MKRIKIALVLCTAALIGASVLYAQSPSGIAITTPLNDSVWPPGTTLPIQVSSTISTVSLTIGSDLWDELPTYPDVTKTSQPFTFQVSLPADVPPGKYSIQAFGRTSNGVVLESAPITIVIESLVDPVALKPQPESIVLLFRGDQMPIGLYGFNTSGVLTGHQGSSRASCQSSAPSVVQVKAPCTAVGIGPGNGSIIIHLGAASATIPVKVHSLAVRGDFDTDGDIDSDDVARLTFWRNQAAALTGDDRDLNSDGKIDALDARVLTTMCSRPRCAIQ